MLPFLFIGLARSNTDGCLHSRVSKKQLIGDWRFRLAIYDLTAIAILQLLVNNAHSMQIDLR